MTLDLWVVQVRSNGPHREWRVVEHQDYGVRWFATDQSARSWCCVTLMDTRVVKVSLPAEVSPA